MTLLLLLRPRKFELPAPERTPLGRAALTLAGEGLEVLLGTSQAAWRACPGRWEPADARLAQGVSDRFSSWNHPEEHALALQGLERLPRSNPPELITLCRDKVATQRALEAAGLRPPELETDPALFQQRLRGWGAGFLKPRYGAQGHGVSRVSLGEETPSALPGDRPGLLEPAVLQRAVPPPQGLASLSLRALMCWDRRWKLSPMVARRSETDPVGNVHRGAQALPAEDLLNPRTLGEAQEQALAAAQAICAAMGEQARWVLELGVDLVVDPEGHCHLIEVNGLPGGRLRALLALDPARFASAEHEACCGPLRGLALRIG